MNFLYPIILASCLLRKTESAVSCPSGDAAGNYRDGQTCSELVTAFNGECYDNTFETDCCASCNGVATGDSSCLYGNGLQVCVVNLCNSYGNAADCCQTCGSSTTNTASSAGTSSTASTTSAFGASSGSGNGVDIGAVVGGVIGGVAGVALVIGSIFLAVKLFKKWKLNKIADDKKAEPSKDLNTDVERGTTREYPDKKSDPPPYFEGQGHDGVAIQNGGVGTEKRDLPVDAPKKESLPPITNAELQNIRDIPGVGNLPMDSKPLPPISYSSNTT